MNGTRRAAEYSSGILLTVTALRTNIVLASAIGIAIVAIAATSTLATAKPAIKRLSSTPHPAAAQTTPHPAALATPGLPRFFNYVSPPGSGNGAGEPSLGSNWLSERTFSNSAGPIPNGGTANYFGGFLPYMLKITFSDCQSPAAPPAAGLRRHSAAATSSGGKLRTSNRSVRGG